MKKYFSRIVATLIVSVMVAFPIAGCSTNESNQQSSSSISTEQVKENTATVTVNGAELTNKSVNVTDKDTVLSVLEKAAKENNIEAKVEGSGNMAYVTQIGDKTAGKNSGWVFTVNGEQSKVGAGAVKIKDGDVIEWTFTEF